VSKGADHVTRQFERVHGPDGPTPDADGKRRGTLEVPRLRRRPGDNRLKQPVGRDAPNRPDDVARLQRALSETGDYTFTAPRERSGVMSANLDTAVTRYQRRIGLNPDGVVAPDGPTVQQIAAEAEADKGAQLRETAESEKTVKTAPTVERSSSPPSEGTASNSEATEANRQPAESKACLQAKKDHLNAQADLEDRKQNLASFQERVENINEAIKEIATGQDETMTEAALDAFIKGVLRRFGLYGFIAYFVYEAVKRVDQYATIENLRSAREAQKREIEIIKSEIESFKNAMSDARKRKLTHCGRNVLPETDAIS
jgi:hypothetical protein